MEVFHFEKTGGVSLAMYNTDEVVFFVPLNLFDFFPRIINNDVFVNVRV